MNIEKSSVTKWLLTDLDALDPVTIIVENYKPGQGKIIVECFGDSWSYYWGAMSGMSLEQFFRSCDNGYLASKLAPGLNSMVPDEGEALRIAAREQVKTLYNDFDIGKNDAEDMLRRIDTELPYGIQDNQELLHELFGDEWWYQVPEKPNHEYEYLCRIIDAVKEAFREDSDDE